MSACPKCGNAQGNVKVGMVGRVFDVPARIIHRCIACGQVWYQIDPEDNNGEN